MAENVYDMIYFVFKKKSFQSISSKAVQSLPIELAEFLCAWGRRAAGNWLNQPGAVNCVSVKNMFAGSISWNEKQNKSLVLIVK